MRVVRDSDLLWELDGPEQGALTGLYVSTEHLTAGRTSIAPGKHSEIHRHGGDECLYVLSGILNVQLPEAEGKSWFELHPQDGFYVPAGVPHQYWNMGKGEALFMFGIAPNYAS
jgi:quercetin dioxygenase-like cupin family protein